MTGNGGYAIFLNGSYGVGKFTALEHIGGLLAAAGANRDRYGDALGLPVRSVRLVASRRVTEAQLRGRYSASQTARYDWHAARHHELSERLARADLDEAIIDTDSRRPIDVAAAVLDHFGYPTEPRDRTASA